MIQKSRATLAHRAALIATACLALGGTAGTLAGFFARHGWVLDLTSHFPVQYLWALTIASGVLAMLGHRRWGLVTAAVAAVNLALILPLYIGPARPGGSGTNIRALSQNVYYANRDFGRVLDLVRAQQPDFALFLEVTPEWMDALRELDDEYPYHRALARPDSGGIAFYSRLEAVSLEFRMVHVMPGIVAHLVAPQGPLTVIGVHPSSPRNSRVWGSRNEELMALGRIAASEPGPLVVLGDLNTTSWSPFFQDLIRTSGMRDSRRGFGVEGTWPALPMPLRIPIDHCLVSPDVTVVDRRIGPYVGSDHRAIIVDFSMPSR